MRPAWRSTTPTTVATGMTTTDGDAGDGGDCRGGGPGGPGGPVGPDFRIDRLPLGRQDRRAHRPAIVHGQESDGQLGILAAGGFHLHFAQTGDARQQRLVDVHGLHPVEPGRAPGPDQPAGTDADLVVGKLEEAVLPRHPGQDGGDGDDEQRNARDGQPHHQSRIGEEVDQVTERRRLLDHVERDGRNRRDEHPCADEQRGDRMDATAAGADGTGHSPAILSRARSDSRSRRARASARGRPANCASEVAEAVLSLTVANPKSRSRGPSSMSMNWMRP